MWDWVSEEQSGHCRSFWLNYWFLFFVISSLFLIFYFQGGWISLFQLTYPIYILVTLQFWPFSF